MRDKNGRFAKGGESFFKGKKHSGKAKEKLRLANIGKKASVKTRNKMSKTRKGRKFSLEHRRNKSEAQRGDKNPNWQGGLGNENREIRRSFEYKLWRIAVFERDDYTCIWCGQGGKLNADHIKPFALFPELRFAIDNGRTLCKKCHETTDTYGSKTKSKV